MKVLSFELEDLTKFGTIQRVTFEAEGIKGELEFIYNSLDGYLYVCIKNSSGEVLLGHTRVVPEIDYFSFNKIKFTTEKQLRFIKVNELAEEVDKITIDNFNKDYMLFII